MLSIHGVIVRSPWLQAHPEVAAALVVAEEAGVQGDYVFPNGEHWYSCTGWRCAGNEHCTSGRRLDGGGKVPACCKWNHDHRCRVHGGWSYRETGETP